MNKFFICFLYFIFILSFLPSASAVSEYDGNFVGKILSQGDECGFNDPVLIKILGKKALVSYGTSSSRYSLDGDGKVKSNGKFKAYARWNESGWSTTITLTGRFESPGKFTKGRFYSSRGNCKGYFTMTRYFKNILEENTSLVKQKPIEQSQNVEQINSLKNEITKLKEELVNQKTTIEKEENTTIQKEPISSVNIKKDTRKRFALVIGNSTYENISYLKNPKSDASALSAKLNKLGFDVSLALDIKSKGTFKKILREYKSKLANNKNSVGLFFYAGHAVQVDGENYLIPTNSDIHDPADLDDESVTLSYVSLIINSADSSMNVFLIDACRDNPFRGIVRSSTRGLAEQNSAVGSLIMFSASPGKVAFDGKGNNSPFTSNLIKFVDLPNIPIELMLKNVVKGVRNDTTSRQTPWIQSSLVGDFYFNIKN